MSSELVRIDGVATLRTSATFKPNPLPETRGAEETQPRFEQERLLSDGADSNGTKWNRLPYYGREQRTAKHDTSDRLNAENQTQANKHGLPRDLTLARKLGKMALFILAGGTMLILSTSAVLAFLWFLDSNNSTWHAIVIRDWTVKTINICSEVLKQSVSLQVGVCTAMLGALALEGFEVLVQNSASVSMMRNGIGTGAAFSLVYQQFNTKSKLGWRNLTLPSFVLLLTIVLILAQVISIVLVSDVGLSLVPGNVEMVTTNFGFTYKTVNTTNIPQSRVLLRTNNWERKPTLYPAFAEYSEPPFIQDGVSDTGVTLRALLPYSAAEDRQNIRSYEGTTTVLDARVTCQVPDLSGATVKISNSSDFLLLSGLLRASRYTPRLANATIVLFPSSNGQGYDNHYNVSFPFSCMVPIQWANDTREWRISICQLCEGGLDTFSVAGGLLSEFKTSVPMPNLSLDEIDDPSLGEVEDSKNYGTAYLLLNITLGSVDTWNAVIGSYGSSQSPPLYNVRGEWLDLIFSSGSLVLSTTLCYSAFDIADLPIKITSKENRTEPMPYFNFTDSLYTFESVRVLLGQYKSSMTPEQRGILSLEPRSSWVANGSQVAPVEPFVRDFANMKGPRGSGNAGNVTAILYGTSLPTGANPWIVPDVLHIWLFQELLTSGASSSFALQSMLTVFSTMAYYDQLAQFDQSGPVKLTYFITSNIPKHFRGFLAVMMLLVIHILLATSIVTWFGRNSRYSILNNSWQGISQIAALERCGFLDKASMMTDDEVEKVMEDSGLKSKRAGLAPIQGTDGVGIVLREDSRSAMSAAALGP